MRRWFAAVIGTAMLALGCGSPATAESPTLIGGGLTALPAVAFGPDLLRNGGFETLDDGVPAGWSAGGGWSADRSVRRSGAFSYRRSTGSPSVAQTLVVQPGTYTLSAWVKTEGVPPWGRKAWTAGWLVKVSVKVAPMVMPLGKSWLK